MSALVLAICYMWPSLRVMRRDRALSTLVAPHLFLRFIGLSFLIPGVVSPSLPATFAVPAAYGDLGAGILASVAFETGWATLAVWVFNV